MTIDELIDSLVVLQARYANSIKAPDQFARFESELKKTLQDYLWEGVPKSLNSKKYRDLSFCYHPDKLMVSGEVNERLLDRLKLEGAQKKKLIDFSRWLSSATDSKEIFFKTLSHISEAYRPELNYRAQDAARDQGERNQDKVDDLYYFSRFGEKFPILYGLLWPIFYLLESLERNLNNIPDPELRKGAKTAFHIAAFLPLLAFQSELVFRLLKLVVDYHPFIAEIVSAGVLSILIQSVLLLVNVVLLDAIAYKFHLFADVEPLTSDYLYLFLIHNPIVKPLNLVYRALQSKNAFLRYSALAAIGVAGVALSATQLYLLSYSAPFLGLVFALPVATIVAINIPIMAYQTYQNPKTAFENTVQYFASVVGVYVGHLKYAYNTLISSWFKTKRAAADPSGVPEPSAPKSSAQKLDINSGEPYWKAKLDKYMAKDEDSLEDKRRVLAKSRRGILTELGFNECDSINDVLDEHIQKRTDSHDAAGHMQEQDEKAYQAKRVACLKAQVIYLKKCQDEKLPKTQVNQRLDAISYPQCR